MADKQFEQTPYSPDRFTLVELERELGSSELAFLFSFSFLFLLFWLIDSLHTRLRPSQGCYSHALGHEEAGPRWQGCPGQLCLQDPPVIRIPFFSLKKTRCRSFLFLSFFIRFLENTHQTEKKNKMYPAHFTRGLALLSLSESSFSYFFTSSRYEFPVPAVFCFFASGGGPSAFLFPRFF